jgi:hypothetical protein
MNAMGVPECRVVQKKLHAVGLEIPFREQVAELD